MLQPWKVPPEWKGETAFIVAGGPSVKEQNVGLLEGRRVIAINSSYQIAPWAQFLFAGDKRWLDHHRVALAKFAGRIVTTCRSVRPIGDRTFYLVKAAATRGITDDAGSVAFGRTSTHGAINLAVHLGVSRIVLLGVDMSPAPDGRAHHHAEHPWPVRPGCWDEQMEHMKYLVKPLRERGVEVINTSPVSRIEWWPRRRLEDCL